MNGMPSVRHSSAYCTIAPGSFGAMIARFYTDAALPPHELWERLCRTELPRLWLPKREDLRVIESIPTLGSGKVDLRAVRQLAVEVAA
jgi:acyl-[acyl-carrier-protein]-phospholipid O-acyltransferase/long-chain-fatty-acid--[acyl-carrier-protein] ligase